MYKLEVSISIVKQTEPVPTEEAAEASADPVERDRNELAGVTKILEKIANRAFPSSPFPMNAVPPTTLRSSQIYDVPNERYHELLDILARFDKLALEIGTPSIEGMPPSCFVGR